MTLETFIDEQVKVWAFFDPSTGPVHVFPIAMNWRRKLIKFEKLIFATSMKIGNKKLVRLTCASDTAYFELEYDTESYLWRLRKIMPNG